MTTGPDDRLKAAYQAHGAARARGADCPEPDQLARWAGRAGVSEQELLEGLDHVMACEGCRREYETLRALAALAAADRPARPAASVATRWLPLAAAVVLSVGAIAVWRLTSGGDDGPVVRDGPEAPTLLAVTPADSVVPAGVPPRFEWRSLPTAVGYRLEVLRDDGSAMAIVETTDTLATVPDSIRLGPGRYLWVVVATTEGGDVHRLVRPLVVR